MNDTKAYLVDNNSNDDLICRIEQAVKAAKMSPEWRDSYMIYQIKQREAELRGEIKGEMKKAKETAYELQADGMPIEKIAKIIKVNVDKVQEWLAEPQMNLAK